MNQTLCTTTSAIIASVIFYLWVGPAYGFAGGTGEPSDPYQIATAEQLISIGDDPNLLDKHFVLVANIDLDPNLPGGRIFTRAVIAPDTNDANDLFDGTPFIGTFDGDGFEVSNLTVQGRDYLGLFGRLYEPAEVSNLRIADANVVSAKGFGYVGGLAALNEGRIVNCQISSQVGGEYRVGGLVGINDEAGQVVGSSARADVDGGRDAYFGGLVGLNDGLIIDSHSEAVVAGDAEVGGLVGSNHGRIRGCYAGGYITDGDFVGGLVGYNEGTVSSSYAVAQVRMGDWTAYPGGLVGKNDGKIVNCYFAGILVNASAEGPTFGGLVGGLASPWTWTRGTVVNSFWNTETSTAHLSQGGTGLTTSEMMDADTYSLNGWAGDPNWVLDPGRDYPRLAWEGTPGEPIPAPTIDWFDGSGTTDDPYRIATAEQLALIGTASVLWDKALVLVSDLDLAGINVPRIGVCRGTGFAGTFDGVNHTISNLTMGGDGVSTSSLGLFGHIDREGRISGLTLREAMIESGPDSYGVGVVAGVNEGLITGGAVVGSNSTAWYSAGILVGLNRGSITLCSAGGSVSSAEYSEALGGLVGENRGNIVNCWADATVDGTHSVGGLVGYNEGTVSSCFAAGRVSGRGSVGGLIGKHSDTVMDCYATGDVTGTDKSRAVAGLVGSNYEGGIVNCYATGRLRGGADSEDFGGLVGYDWDDGHITGCFWDIKSSGLTISAGGTGLATTQMQDPNTFLTAGWDLSRERGNGTVDMWFTPEGGGYPALTSLSGDFLPRQLSGRGTADDPYQIASAEDLGAVNHHDARACYRLTADVNLGGITWRQAPIRLLDGPFDGAGHVVSNLRAPLEWGFGLFGELGRDAVVANLGLAHVDIVGTNGYAGMLAARNSGRIEQCYAKGTIVGSGTFGGLVGSNWGSIRNSYVTGAATGDRVIHLGGLAGRSYGTIDQCYAAAEVSGKAVAYRGVRSSPGGLVSRIGYGDGPVTDSYYLIEVDGGGPTNGRGVELSDEDMRRQTSFVDWDFDTIWMICEGQDYPHLQWENVRCEE